MFVLLYSSTALTQTLTIAGGQTIRSSTTEHDAYRLEANFGWKPELWSTDSLMMSLGHAVSIMTFRDENTVNALSWAPNIIITPRNRSGLIPYAQFGFGVAYLSEDKFESKTPPNATPNDSEYYNEYTSEMGSQGQFESSVAIGLMKGQFSVRAKYYHYSNANITSDNGGMDVAEFGISYSF
tara:strand:- start:196 stop:741 length:546 start_codon:yes stop_codon:yes gene_type:complete